MFCIAHIFFMIANIFTTITNIFDAVAHIFFFVCVMEAFYLCMSCLRGISRIQTKRANDC